VVEFCSPSLFTIGMISSLTVLVPAGRVEQQIKIKDK
jgi:hypothetical protein